MGALFAKKGEEQAEYNAGKIRAKRFLEMSSPSYVDDIDLLGYSGGTPHENEETSTLVDAESVHGSEEGSQAGDSIHEDGGEQHERDPNDPRVRVKMRVAMDKKALIESAAKGGMSGLWQVRYLLRKPHIHPDYMDAKGRCAMYVAAERGNHGVIDALILNRGKCDLPHRQSAWTPLHAATFHGQVKCMEALIAAGVGVSPQDNHGCTPLILAASSPKLYVVDLVSASDRRKRKTAREGALYKQQQIDAGKGVKGNISDPYTMWKFFPNRMELICIGVLLKEIKSRDAVDKADYLGRTPLIYAARYGRIYAASRLLAAQADPHRHDAAQRTPLWHAAKSGHNETVEMFLRVGASPNDTDERFVTPLHAVLENGDDTLANTLISSSASVNAIDCEGRTPIMIAMDTANHMMFGALIDRRADWDALDKRGRNVIMYAVETDMLGEVLPLLARCGEKVKTVLRLYDPQGRNSLHHASFHPNTTQATLAMESLIKLDAEAAKIGDCNGDTAVHLAAELGRLEMLRVIGAKLGTLNFRNHRGDTPLMYAAHGGHMASVIALLEDRGQGPLCDAGMVDEEGRTFLMHACASGHLDLVNMILQNREGAEGHKLKFPPLDINQRDKNGTTALHVAASEGYWQLLPSLVLAGANKASKDNDGCTALHAAAIEDEVLAVCVLIDIGLDMNTGDNWGWTPLMHAAWKGADDVVRHLVDVGCSLDARNCDGDTCLQICIRRKDKLVKRTIDLLTDGLIDRDFDTTHGVGAKGHFMITCVGAKDLYHEGKADQISSYVYLELCTKRGDSPLVAYSTCIMTEANPQWHETFRFDVEHLDPSSYLIAWVVSAPGEEPEDIVTGAAFGLSEKQLGELAFRRATAAATGVAAPHQHKVDFRTALDKALKKQTTQADRADDREVNRLAKISKMDRKPAPSTFQRHTIPVLERRWNEVMNLRQLLQKTGCDVMDPLIPKTHLPIGCVVARFRHLRGAVWGTEPVTMDRTMRLSCKGSLRIEMDFRPQYFIACDPLKGLGSAEADERPRTPRAEDLEESAETASLAAHHAKNRPPPSRIVLSSAGGDNIFGGRSAMADNPVELYQKFLQVSVWAGKVMDARSKLVGEETEAMGFKDPAQEGYNRFRSYYVRYANRYRIWKEKRAMRLAMLDKQVSVSTVPLRPVADMSKDTRQEIEKAEKHARDLKRVQERLPTLRMEPWLEDICDGSRFV